MMDIHFCPDCEGPVTRIDGRIYPIGEKHVVFKCDNCYWRVQWTVPIDFDMIEKGV